jgi:hypothetical protein
VSAPAAATVRDVSLGTAMCDWSRQVSTAEKLHGRACRQPGLVVDDGSALETNGAVLRSERHPINLTTRRLLLYRGRNAKCIFGLDNVMMTSVIFAVTTRLRWPT